MAAQKMTRRESIKKSASIAAGVVGAAGVSGSLAGCEKDTLKSLDQHFSFDVASEAILAVEGGSVVSTVESLNGGRPVIIIRSTENKFTVLSSICTHQGCQVLLPQSADADILCPCHGSKYSQTDGSVKEGPATDALTSFTTTFNSKENTLSIYG